MLSIERKKSSLRKNDLVQVIAGREKGKTGKILKIDLKSDRVTIEKTNMVKRHTKRTQTSAGGIIEKELPIHYSNVLLVCPKCNRGVRHGMKHVESPAKGKVPVGAKAKKMRVCKRCNESLDVA